MGQQAETTDRYKATLAKPRPLKRIHWNEFMTYRPRDGQT
jgi:hypothetical protein